MKTKEQFTFTITLFKKLKHHSRIKFHFFKFPIFDALIGTAALNIKKRKLISMAIKLLPH